MKESKKYVFYVLSSSEFPELYRYLGVTCRKLNARLSQHKYTARHKEKRSTPVAKWIFNLLENNFEVIITKIHECEESEWEATEINLISEYRELGYDLLNVDKGGRGSITIEQRSKCGIQRSIEAHEIKVVQLDLKGNYVKTFDSIAKASKELGLSSGSAITNALNGWSKTSCDSYWVYESDYLSGNYTLKKKVNPSQRKGIKHYQYSVDTHELLNTYDSIARVFYKITGFERSNSDALKKSVINKTTWHGYYWSTEPILDFTDYFDDRFSVLEIDLSGKVINKFRTNIEVAEYFNLAASTISNKIRTKSKTKNNTYLIKNSR